MVTYSNICKTITYIYFRANINESYLLLYLSLLFSILLLYSILIYLFDNLNNNVNYTNLNFLQNSYAIEEDIDQEINKDKREWS